MTAQELLDKINGTSKNDDAGFKEIINLVIDNLYVDASEVRNELGIGRGTLKRWKFGYSAPHSEMRTTVLSWLTKKVQVEIDYRERNRGPIFFSTNCGSED